MKCFANKQSGSVSTLTVAVIVGVCFLFMQQMAKRAQNEIEREQHAELVADKGQVKSALRSLAQCPRNLPRTCTPGERLRLNTIDGNELVSKDGSKRIGRWNIKVECSEKGYWVYVARLNGEQVLKDPLTKQALDWKELSSLNETCGNEAGVPSKLLGNVCYGAIEGMQSLPPEIARRCQGCPFQNSYCGDDQVAFPPCPQNFHVAFRYVDRYGWGGMDLTKYTLCRQNL